LSVDIHSRLQDEDYDEIYNGIVMPEEYDSIDIKESAKEHLIEMLKKNLISPLLLKNKMASWFANGDKLITLNDAKNLADDDPIRRIADLFIGPSED